MWAPRVVGVCGVYGLSGLWILLQVACHDPPPAPPAFPAGRVVDLTHAFDQDTITWPTESGFELERGSEGVTEAGYYYVANRFRSPEHGGTHLDAPIHFHANRWHVDEIPLDRLLGHGILVDMAAACASDRDYRVSVRDLQEWEARHGPMARGNILLLRTGFGRHWSDRERYMGTKARGAEAVAELHFPGLHPEAARWLVEERGIGAVGLDTPSIDFGQSKLFQSHVVLFEANVPVFENLANLDRLPETGFQVIALPMKIRGGSGAPLRIVAILAGGEGRDSARP